MIDKIETVMVEIENLRKSDEIECYIENYLGIHFPEPKRLQFTYILTGRASHRQAIVSYTLKENLLDNETIKHPHSILKHLLKRTGNYIILYHNRALEIDTDRGTVKSLINSSIVEIYNKEIDRSSIVICDKLNLKKAIKQLDRTPLELEKIYRRTNTTIFNNSRRSKKSLIITTLTLMALTILVTGSIIKLNRMNRELIVLKDRYQQLELIERESIEKTAEIDGLKMDIKRVEEQLEPDIYSILYELYRFGKDYRVHNLTWAGSSLQIDAETIESIELISSLNKSRFISFKQNSTTPNGSIEEISFRGELQCN